jgi:flagellin-like protein
MDKELGPHMELALKKGLIGVIAVLILLAVVFVVQGA